MVESRNVAELGSGALCAAAAVRRAGASRGSLVALLLAGAAITTAAPVAAAGTLDLGGVIVTRTNFDNGGTDYDFVQNGTLKINPTVDLGYAGVLRDGGVGQIFSLNKFGGHTLTLSGANTYSGSTLVTSGVLAAGADNTFSANSLLIANALVELNGYDQTVAGFSGSGDIQNSTGGTATLTSDLASGTRTQSGNIYDVVGSELSLVKTGAGTQIVNGVNTYRGGTTIQNGRLGFGNASSLGTGAVVFNTAGAPGATATLRAIGSNVVLPNDLVLTTDGYLDSFGHSPTFTGVISGGGKLIKVGTTEARIDNVGNSYSGGTELAGGGLLLGASNVLGSGTLTVSAGGRLNAVTTAALDNAVVLNADLKVDRPGTTLTLNGVVSGGVGNNLTVTDGATLNLTAANTYAGNTYITSTATDTSALGVGNALALSGGLHTIIATGTDPAHPAVLRALGNFTLPAGNVFRVNGALDIDTNDGVVTHQIQVTGPINDFNGFSAGSLAITGGGKVTLLSASNGYTLGTTVSGFSQLQVTNNAQLGAGNAGISLDQGYLEIAGTAFGATTRTISLSGFGVVEVQDAAATVDLGLVQGGGQLYKFGAGTFTLSGVNTYTGGTFVDGGTIDFKSNDSFSTGFVYLATGARITTSVDGLVLANAFNLDGGTIETGAANLTLNGPIGGTGALIKTGTGRFDINGNNAYTGGTTVSQGEIRVGTGTALGTGTATFAGGTTLSAGATVTLANAITINGNNVAINTNGNDLTLTGGLGGSGYFGKNGAGTLIIGGVNTVAGGGDVLAGTLQVDGSFTGPSSFTQVLSGATLSGTGTLDTANVLNGGILAPGDGGIGTLTLSDDLTLTSGSFLNFELGAPAAAHDLIVVNDHLTSTGRSTSSIWAAWRWAPTRCSPTAAA